MIPLKIIIRYPPFLSYEPMIHVKWTTLEEWQVSRDDLVQLREDLDNAVRDIDNAVK